jgi:hypothetical protein
MCNKNNQFEMYACGQARTLSAVPKTPLNKENPMASKRTSISGMNKTDAVGGRTALKPSNS